MDEPNKTIQDLERHYLLCHDCEEEFSVSEKWFAENIFYSWKKGESIEFEYNSNLHYFVTSLSWRSILLDIMNFVRDGYIDIQKLQIMIESEKTMKDYLLRKRNDIGTIENHIFFFERMGEVGQQCARMNFPLYLISAIQPTLLNSYNSNFILTIQTTKR